MSRYIDAESLYTELEQLYKDNGWERMEAHFSLSDMECNIHFMPTANVRENVKGKWEYNTSSCGPVAFIHRKCSECGYENMGMGTKYCPDCGARMEGTDADT